MTNGLSHPYHLDESISILGALGPVFVSFFNEIVYRDVKPQSKQKQKFFNEFLVSKQISPRCDAAFCGVTSGADLFAYVP